MQRCFFLSALCGLILSGCADLTFLDAAVSEAGRNAPAPELLPRDALHLPEAEDIATDEDTERLLARAAALQRRAAAAQ